MLTASVSLRPIPPGARFDAEQLRRGIEVEMEHTTDPAIAELIAKHHLLEDPRYYDKLRAVHLDR